MAGDGGIKLQLTVVDRLEGMDPPSRRIHFSAQHSVTCTGWQAETAVHAGVGGVCWEAAQNLAILVWRDVNRSHVLSLATSMSLCCMAEVFAIIIGHRSQYRWRLPEDLVFGTSVSLALVV